MTKYSKTLRQPADQPAFDARFARLTTKHEKAMKSAAAPNIRVEQTLFNLYLQEKARADHLALRCNQLVDRNRWLQDSITKRKQWSRIKKLAPLKVGPKQ